MSCYRPLEAHKGLSGEVWVGYDPTRDGRSFQLPCGRCIGCRLDRSRAWAVRITHEAQLYDSNWFATFTYNDEFLPKSGSLEYLDFQLFMKRLRRKMRGQRPGPEGNYPLRFFCAGEYGGRTGRPHFHAILFNARFGDEKPLMNGRFRSTFLESIWSINKRPMGNVVLEDVNVRTAAYVAGYTLAKAYQNRGYTLGRKKRQRFEEKISRITGEVQTRRVAFAAMSLRPGIGATWYNDFKADLFPADFAVSEGKRSKVPRYYWEKFRLHGDDVLIEEIEYARFLRAQEQIGESTAERRAVREEIAQRRLAFFQEREL